MSALIEVEWAGETLVPLPERALYWPRERTLFVADIHLGKAEAFRAGAIPVPHGTTTTMLARLDRIVASTRCERLIFLGDLWHDRAGRTQRIDDAFLDWRLRYTELEVVLVEGNHDRKAGRVPEGFWVLELQEPCAVGPFALRHYPEPLEGCHVLAGHLHPAVKLDGRGGQSLCLPCFWFGASVGVLPAFGDFTGVARVRPQRGDRVLVVADNKVISVA